MCGGARRWRRWRGPRCLRRRWMSHRGTVRWATAAGAFMLTDFRADDAFHRPKPIHEGRNVGKGHCFMVAPS